MPSRMNAMTLHGENAEIVSRLMNQAITDLEAGEERGHFYTTQVRSLGEVARLLGYDDVAQRCAKLLATAPDWAFWAGVITNLPRDHVPPLWRVIPPQADLEREYPPYDEEQVLDFARKCAATERHSRSLWSDSTTKRFSRQQQIRNAKRLYRPRRSLETLI